MAGQHRCCRPLRPALDVRPFLFRLVGLGPRCLASFAMFFLATVLAAVFYDAHQPINHNSISVSEGVLSGVSELAIAAMAIVVVGSLTRLRGLSFSDIGWEPAWGKHHGYGWQAVRWRP